MKCYNYINFLFVLSIACSASPSPIPTKNLDRPRDMGFVCLGTIQSERETSGLELTGLPISRCQPHFEKRPVTTVNDERKLGTFTLITEEGHNDLIVADLDKGRLVDLSEATVGYGALPLPGPSQSISVSTDGCQAVVSTQGFSELTAIDTSRFLSSVFLPTKSSLKPSTGEGSAFRQFVVHTSEGVLIDSPIGEIVHLPSIIDKEICSVGSSFQLIATFPQCGMVGVLDLSYDSGSAKLLSAVRLNADGTAEKLSSPVRCVKSQTGGSAGETNDEKVTNGPSVITLVPDGSKVFVASRDNAIIYSFPIANGELGDSDSIVLTENARGVSKLRLSTDPFVEERLPQASGLEKVIQGRLLGGRGAFLYAFAMDGSLRVIDINKWIECDVNVLVNQSRDEACFSVGSAKRRPLATGPGVQIQNVSTIGQPPFLIRDIAFVDLVPPVDENVNQQSLRGQFAFVLASNNVVYILNIAPENEPFTLTNSFREFRELGNSVKTPLSLTVLPQRFASASEQPFTSTKTISIEHAPNLESFEVDGTEQFVQLPDPDQIVSKSWDVIWEGTLNDSKHSSGKIDLSDKGDYAGALEDKGGSFCSIGIRPGDILSLPGCSQNSDCQPEDEFYCELSLSSARGLCLPKNRKSDDQLRANCRRFVTSRMRYEIQKISNATLMFGLLLDEVPKPSNTKCLQDSDCQVDTEHSNFKCIKGSKAGEFNRCLQPCNNIDETAGDAECRIGHVCERVPVGADPGYCVEAPPIKPECWSQPDQNYQLFAGKSYLVKGSALPTFKNAVILPDGSCKEEEGDVSLQDRIPLSAPFCPQDFLDQRHATDTNTPIQVFEPRPGFNPCLFISLEGTQSPVSAYFQNPQIRFVMKNVDTYVADLYSIHFEFQYGFSPLMVSTNYEILMTAGIKILTSPMRTPESPVEQNPATGQRYFPYLYVIDQGRTMTASGSRGQIIRINPRSGSSAVPAFDMTVSGKTPFQIQ